MRHFRRLPTASIVSLLLIMGGVGLLGANNLRNSSAATAWSAHYPYGSIDHCSLSGSTTYIFGWANDPEALQGNHPYYPQVDIKAGSQTQRVSTGIASYHSTTIDTYISGRYPNQPISTDFSPRRDFYGFKASFTNLYKGNSYAVSGTALNYPTDNSDGGYNNPLSLNTSGTNLAGWADSPYFAGGVIPSSCLVTPPNPSVTLTASPTTVISGTASTLTWSSQNTTSCTASGSWSGTKGLSGSGYNTGTLTANATYTLTCTGFSPSLKASATASVTVTAPPSSGGGSSGGSSGSGGTTPPAPVPKPTPSSGTTTTQHSGTPVSSASPPSITNDAVVAIGTASADLKIPAGNASKVYVTFNADGFPEVDTSEQQMYSDGITIHVPGLSAKTTYNYTITRTNSAGVKATSTSKSFTTGGYQITLHFATSKNKPVSDIAGTIDDTSKTKTTSDKNGDMIFKDLADGIYTITYDYKKSKYTSSFDTNSSQDISSVDQSVAHTVVLGDTINVDSLTSTASPNKSKSSGGGGGAWVIILSVIAVVVIVFIFIRRRMARQMVPDYYSAPAVSDTSVTPVISDADAKDFAKQQAKAGPPPEHMGESLRDLVIQSMHEEAERRKKQGPPEDPQQ